MKKTLPLFFILFSFHAKSQTFTATPGSAITSLTNTTSSIVVSGIGEINCDFGLLQVCIDISHAYDADLDIYLTDPNGDQYTLSSDNGGSGDNYSVTCFDMNAATNVTAGSAPFNGSYRPEGNIGYANNYQNADGTWTLRVYDDALFNTGTLDSWSLVFGDDPECLEPMTSDCRGGITLCTDLTLVGNSSGSGNYGELNAGNDGCLSGEHESSWYFFQAASDGTYAFEIITLVDYDFAIWGPLTSIVCPPNAAPSRCSYSGSMGNTGLQAGAGDDSEGSGGDRMVNPIIAQKDDIFIIVIDNYTADGTSFEMNWTLTGGASLDCTLLPIELLSFEIEREGGMNEVTWETASEINNDYYILEKSSDGVHWETVSTIEGAGNSSNRLTYKVYDLDQSLGIVYYSLKNVDFNGEINDLDKISLAKSQEKEIVQIVNLLGEPVDNFYKGLRVIVYSDGTTKKVISQ